MGVCVGFLVCVSPGFLFLLSSVRQRRKCSFYPGVSFSALSPGSKGALATGTRFPGGCSEGGLGTKTTANAHGGALKWLPCRSGSRGTARYNRAVMRWGDQLSVSLPPGGRARLRLFYAALGSPASLALAVLHLPRHRSREAQLRTLQAQASFSFLVLS